MITMTDIDERSVKANCQFEYKGFTISVSTLFGRQAAVAVFHVDFEKYGLQSVEEAILLIEQMRYSKRS